MTKNNGRLYQRPAAKTDLQIDIFDMMSIKCHVFYVG